MSESSGRGFKVARVMLTYAFVMIVAGVVAFSLAPEGAKATTALGVPAACGTLMILCGLMARAFDSKPVVGKIGVNLGLVLSLLFAAVIGMRAMKTGEAVSEYAETAAAWAQGPGANGDASDEDRTAFFTAADAPDHDKSYLRNTLWFLTAASLIAFGGILVSRPRTSSG